MTVFEIVLIGVALSMDAVAVGLTNGMEEPSMSPRKIILVALCYGFFQFLMPVLGYYLGSAFAALVEKIAPWLSFLLLAFLGGKMILDRSEGKSPFPRLTVRRRLGAGKLLVQGVATSIDALAVGVALLASERTVGLPFPVFPCSLLIGIVTFCLSLPAVLLGKRAGGRLSGSANAAGGVILIAIGLKLLFEGIL